jgi:transcriptional regulator with XRE-family HTH domain
MTTTAIARKLSAIREKSTLSSTDIATVTGAQPETVSKWNQSKAVPRPDAQRRLLDLEYIVDLLSDLYDQPDDVKLWLISRQKLLGGRIPADLIHDGKTEDVIAIIDQLRDSVFA